jgi:NlpC/P60 family protein
MAGAKAKRLLWVVVLGAFTSLALAQHTPKSTAKRADETSAIPVSESTSSRLLTADEGLAIIGSALETRHSRHANGDCSHLVHAIYEQAGFSYRYADSSQLYDGTENFRRVTHPQPGDLAVWRGHAAIVINPAQNSFFSATRSGLRVQSYSSKYWKRRGPPRFFRYMKTASPSAPSAIRTATDKRPTLRNVGSRTPITVERDSDDLSTDDPSTPALPTSSNLPRILVLHAPQPKPKQVDERLSQHFDETDKALRSQDVLRLSQPLAVFDHIEVKSVHLKGNQAWAGVKIDGLSSLIAGSVTPKKRSEEQRWVLTRRDADTWELLLPLKTTYLPHDLAVRILANRLAALADHTLEAADSSKEQAQLARILNLLLEK